MLAIGLYRLSHGVSYSVTATAFNIGKTTAQEAFRDAIHALNLLKRDIIRFPTTKQDREDTIKTFTKSLLPNILGAIDGTHY